MTAFGLDRLQKELDALTYNSRSVLNALIHSVVVAGTNNGFKATRAGVEILLTRMDIYQIYSFYQDWETNSFYVGARQTNPVIIGFSDLLEQHDNTTVIDEDGNETKGNTTPALVRHSQIMFMNSQNKDQPTNASDPDNYWLNLIKTSNNPKLITNTAPIPINLRTPVLDTNLATTKYNTYPTYILPMGYFNADILGFSGDDVDHVLGGKSYTIIGDEYINLQSDNISLGSVDLAADYKTQDKRTGYYSLSFGFDSNAQGDYSLAGGFHSIVPKNNVDGDDETNTQCAIAVGDSNIASYDRAVSLGGFRNSTSNLNAASIGGEGNIVTGKSGGILGGLDNIVGGKWFDWTYKNVNMILISGNQTGEFRKDDTVVLFDYTVKGDAGSQPYYATDGDGEKARQYIVDGVEYFSTTSSGGVFIYFTQISLNGELPRTGVINGGKVSKITDGTTEETVGENANAFGHGCIAEGKNQFVIGSYNDRTYKTAKFVIGVGTNDSDDRKNVFECYNDGFICYGTPANGNTFLTDIEPTDTFIGAKVSAYGLDVLVKRQRFQICHDSTDVFNFKGFKLSGSESDDDGYVVSATINEIKLYNITNKITIQSGDDSFTYGSDTDKKINLFADENINIEAHKDINILSTLGNISISWDGTLSLTGDTFGALPTNDTQYSHYTNSTLSADNFLPDYTGLSGDDIASFSIFKTGFYSLSTSTFKGTNLILGPGGTAAETTIQTNLGIGTDGKYFLLNIGDYRDKEELQYRYHNWQLIFGMDPDEEGHIGVRRSYNDPAWLATNAITGDNIKYLAWYEDLSYQYPTSEDVYALTPFGEWNEISSADLEVWEGKTAQERELCLTGAGYNYENITTGYDVKLRYTIIRKTLFFELYIKFTDLPAYTEFVNNFAIQFKDTKEYYRTLFEPDFIQPSADLWKIAPSFSCTTYFRNVSTSVIPVTPSDPYNNRIYICHIIDNQTAGGGLLFPKGIGFIISRSSYDGAGIPQTLFTADYDNNVPIYFSGSYPLKNIAPF